MSAPHTPGEARIALETGRCVVAVGEREILECYQDGEPQTLEDEANARRVVACWNAFDGLVAVAKKARRRLGGTNIMGEKLNAPLLAEIDAALKLARGGR